MSIDRLKFALGYAITNVFGFAGGMVAGYLLVAITGNIPSYGMIAFIAGLIFAIYLVSGFARFKR